MPVFSLEPVTARMMPCSITSCRYENPPQMYRRSSKGSALGPGSQYLESRAHVSTTVVLRLYYGTRVVIISCCSKEPAIMLF